MAKQCVICNKKISLFGRLITTKYKDDLICFDCSNIFDTMKNVYGSDKDEYSLEQLKQIANKKNELQNIQKDLEKYLDIFKRIENRIDNDIKACEKEIEENNKFIEETNREAEQEITKLNIELKKLDNDPEMKELKAQYRKYSMVGDTLRANNVDTLIKHRYDNLREDIGDVKNWRERYTFEPTQWILIEKECINNLSKLKEKVSNIKEYFIYLFNKTKRPAEKDLFGFELKNSNEEKYINYDEFILQVVDVYRLGDLADFKKNIYSQECIAVLNYFKDNLLAMFISIELRSIYILRRKCFIDVSSEVAKQQPGLKYDMADNISRNEKGIKKLKDEMHELIEQIKIKKEEFAKGSYVSE